MCYLTAFLKGAKSYAPRERINMNGYRGIHHINGKYVAQLTFNYQTIYLGYFKTAVEAAHAYDQGAYKLYGTAATLNFPGDV